MTSEEHEHRDEHDRVPWSQLLAEAKTWPVIRLDDAPPEPRRSPRRRMGQSLVEYIIVMGMVAGLGFTTMKGVAIVMDKTVNKVTAVLDNLEFVKNAPRRAARRHSSPPMNGGAIETLGRAPARVPTTTSDCKHPRVRAGECLVCHQAM